MTMMGSTMAGNAQTITSLGGVLPTPASPSKAAKREVREARGKGRDNVQMFPDQTFAVNPPRTGIG